MAADRRILDEHDFFAQRLIQSGLALGTVKIAALCFTLPQQLHHRDRLIEQLLHRPRTLRLDQIIRVQPLWHQRKTQRLPRLKQRQCDINHPHRGAQTSGVTIQRDNRLGRHTPHQAQLIFGNGGAKRRDRRCKPRLRKGNDIHIALSHDQRLALSRRLACRAMVVEAAALVKKRGFGGIIVFRRMVRVHGSTAKTNGPPPRITDREHDPVAKPVIKATASVTLRRKPRINDQFRVNPLARKLFEHASIGRCKADLPARLHFRAQAAPRQIIPRIRSSPCLQLQTMVLHRLLHHIDQHRARIRLFLCARITFRHRHPRLSGKDFHSLHEINIFGFAHKGNRIAFGMAAKAVIKPLAVIDVETGGFFLMERARRPKIALALIGLARVPHDLTAHDLPQRQPIAQFIKETRGQTHARSMTQPLGTFHVQSNFRRRHSDSAPNATPPPASPPQDHAPVSAPSTASP